MSCATASFCAAVSATGTAQTYNGTTWTARVTTDASPGGAEQTTGMIVSCPSASMCVAAGEGHYAIWR